MLQILRHVWRGSLYCMCLQLKPAGTLCRESGNSCDLPEFCTGANPHCPANVYLHDGHACHNVDGYCYNGICQTHEQQCITLWGPGKLIATNKLDCAHNLHFSKGIFHFILVIIFCVFLVLSVCAGAKPAPGICFERVNSAGDPYGNCGKDSKGSFAKCDAR